MSTAVVVLAIAVLFMGGALVAVLRQKAAPTLDADTVRRWLAEANSARDTASPAVAQEGQASVSRVGEKAAEATQFPARVLAEPDQRNGTEPGATTVGATGGALEASGYAGLAELREEAIRVAAQIRTAAGEAAENLREQSRADADRLLDRARTEADRTVADARAEAERARAGWQAERAGLLAEATQSVTAERVDLQAAQERVQQTSATIAQDKLSLAGEWERVRSERQEAGVERADLDRRRALSAQLETSLADRAAALAAAQTDLDGARQAHAAAASGELSRISGLTEEAARAELLAGQEDAVRRDAAFLIRRVESEAVSEAKFRARAIVAEAIQRVASDTTAQTVVSVLHLPSDDVKGRIIGREGRNIRTFETVTGVNVIIDDTPEAVLLSCFDPVRREVGRVTLQMLIDDGRIHPHRIEEAFERAGDEVEALCRRAAEDALLDVGINDLHPELVTLIGHLKYRTSYGQNVLGHLIETSHIARIMAAELGVADPAVVARAAFLHDIGKALTHESLGSHATVGADLARRYGESEDVAHAIEAHHDEVAPATIEAVLTQAADSCSGGRPGARRESLESYVQRLEKIETIASAKKGVEKVFAMQAGRELRIMVKPEVVDDLEAHVLAREVAKQIEEELTYPGQVRVTVIRESRATEIAR